MAQSQAVEERIKALQHLAVTLDILLEDLVAEHVKQTALGAGAQHHAQVR